MKKNKNLLFLFFIAFFLFQGCGTQKGATLKPSDNSFTVDWNKVDNKPVPKIIDDPVATIGPSPLPGNKQYISKTNSPEKPTALVLGPGVYRAVSHIALLKEMRLNSKEPLVVMGHGLASIIAAYFAFGFEPDYIEWKLFKFINELDSSKPFSKDWIRAAETKLLDELSGKRIEEGRLTLIVPVKDLKSRKVIFQKRGDLKKHLLANIDPRGYFSKELRPAFTEKFVERKPFITLGVGKIYAVDLLTEGITWKTGSGFLNGLFEKGATVTLKSKQKVDIMIVYPLSDFKVDDKGDVADLVFKSKKLARENLKQLDTKQANKIEEDANKEKL